MDNPEIQDPTERQEAPALLDPKAHLVALDPKAHLEMPEPQPLQPQPPLATLVHKETQAHKVLPDLLEALERTLNLALKDPLDHQANLEATASLEPLDLRDQRDLLDPKENVVFARNIAPWTVEFSSKMEHGGKRAGARLYIKIEKGYNKKIIYRSFCNFFLFLSSSRLLFECAKKRKKKQLQ